MTHLSWQLRNLRKKKIETKDDGGKSAIIGTDCGKQRRGQETTLSLLSLVTLPEIWTTDEELFEKKLQVERNYIAMGPNSFKSEGCPG